MKLPFAILLTIAGTGLAATAADARPGCGRGAELRQGHCRQIRGDRRAAGQDRWVAGKYYNGRGYWDGRRWYQHRERANNGWRYR